MNYKKTEEANIYFILTDDLQKIEDLNYFLKEFLEEDIADFDTDRYNYQINISIKNEKDNGATLLNVKLKSTELDVRDTNQLYLFNQNEDDLMMIKDKKIKFPPNTKIEIISNYDNANENTNKPIKAKNIKQKANT